MVIVFLLSFLQLILFLFFSFQEIKQEEDIVELGEDEADWGDVGGAGPGDSSTDNTVNFSDMLMPPHTPADATATGDSAMVSVILIFLSNMNLRIGIVLSHYQKQI